MMKTKITGSVLVTILAVGVLASAQSSSSRRERDARAPIEAYFKAFNARDNDAMRKTIHYPHVRIDETGGVRIWQTPADAIAESEALAKTEGWARSSLDSVKMRSNGDTKVHFEIVFSRYKADGTKYATYQSLWIVTKKDGQWGVQARSSFAP